MRDLPPGFQLHRGLDGLLAGLFLVFVVKVERAVSRLIDWRLVPEWTYRPIKVTAADVNTGISTLFGGLRRLVGSGGSAGGTGGSTDVLGPVLGAIGSGLVKVVGSPVVLTGVRSAAIVEQLVVIAGVWIAVLVPLWCWGIRPALFWWRDRGPD